MKIGNVINLLKDPKMIKELLRFHAGGYLRQIGWFESNRNNKPVDIDGQPIPWVTYSFIDFIRDRLDKTMTLLEYGSGNSTLFYGSRVKNVHTVENDKGWFDEISRSMPSNVEMKYIDLVRGGEYSKYGQQFPNTFDIVIVDGRDRVNCLKNSLGSLTARGVMVLDDTERTEYSEAIKFMVDKGFRKIDFSGIAPGVFYRKSTTVFYRDNNCLKI